MFQLQSQLNQRLVDQIPPLAEFQRWLVQLSVAGAHQVWKSSSGHAKPFILELVAEVRQHLLKQLTANWSTVVDKQRQLLSDESPETLRKYISHFNPAVAAFS